MAETKTAKELKKELQTVRETLMKEVDDDCNLHVIDDALEILVALKNPVLFKSGQVGLKMVEDLGKKEELKTVTESSQGGLEMADDLGKEEELGTVTESSQGGLEMADDLDKNEELETVTESGQASEEVSVQCSRRVKKLKKGLEDLMKDDQEVVNPVVVESSKAFLVQCSKRVKELKEELEPVIEALMKEDDHDRIMKGTDNAIDILLEIRELTVKINDQKLKIPVVDESGQESDAMKLKAISLLEKLPCSSVSEDIDVMTEFLPLAQRLSYVRGLFGRIQWPINKLLNRTSIERSQSDVYLQALMSKIVLIICKHQQNWSTIIQDCSETLPFLIACLRTQARTTAAAALSKLSVLTSNRKMMVESGVIEPAVKLIIFEEDSEALTFACMITYYLCLGDVENIERAVSEGVVGAAMDKIRSHIHVDEMLRVLDVLSKDEKVVAELEENGMLPCLFMILRENVDEKTKEYCMNIIHTMCHGSKEKMRKINEVENARKTLQGVVHTGSIKASDKARELLSG